MYGELTLAELTDDDLETSFTDQAQDQDDDSNDHDVSTDDYGSCDECLHEFKLSDLDDDSLCACCVARLVQEAAQQALMDDAVSEVEELESDLEGMESELAELRERMAECKRSLKTARAKVAKLGG